jgi:sec-independent protein translocase protein TatB
MFATLGMWDTLLLMALALVVFGPRRLPKIGRQLGKLMYEFRKASNDFKFQMEEELRNAEEADRRKKEEEDRQRALAAAAPAQAEAVATQTEASGSGTVAAESSAVANADAANPAGTTDPYVEGGEARPQEATGSDSESAIAEAVDAAKLRIQPPSTGETVAAERPREQPERDEAIAGDSGAESEPVTPEPERSEPAAHHG